MATIDVLAALREMAREQPVAVTVRGGCMAPRIADGDRVEVAPARLYWPGDVIVFRSADGRWLVHRLLGWRWWQGRPRRVTRGDGCPCHDAPVPFGRVLGRVVGTRPAGAVPAACARRPAFLRLALRAPAPHPMTFGAAFLAQPRPLPGPPRAASPGAPARSPSPCRAAPIGSPVSTLPQVEAVRAPLRRLSAGIRRTPGAPSRPSSSAWPRRSSGRSTRAAGSTASTSIPRRRPCASPASASPAGSTGGPACRRPLDRRTRGRGLRRHLRELLPRAHGLPPAGAGRRLVHGAAVARGPRPGPPRPRPLGRRQDHLLPARAGAGSRGPVRRPERPPPHRRGDRRSKSCRSPATWGIPASPAGPFPLARPAAPGEEPGATRSVPLGRAEAIGLLLACSPFVNVDPHRREALLANLAACCPQRRSAGLGPAVLSCSAACWPILERQCLRSSPPAS